MLAKKSETALENLLSGQCQTKPLETDKVTLQPRLKTNHSPCRHIKPGLGVLHHLA